MNVVFYLSAVVAVIATLLVITRSNAMHALLYLILSLLAVAIMFFTLGATFVALLEVMVYAGAIMVLFIFAIMLLNPGERAVLMEKGLMRSTGIAVPLVMTLILLGELIYVLAVAPSAAPAGGPVPPQQVGLALYTTYLIGVELASVLLLVSLVGAYHLGRHYKTIRGEERREVIVTTEQELNQPGMLEVIGEEQPQQAAEGDLEIEKER
jgi:NADH-quinone oxidoreductase subunit J